MDRQATARLLEAEWYNDNIDDETYVRICRALDVPTYPSAESRLRRLSTVVRDLLTTPCTCQFDRGRHAPDCRYQFIHDYLDDEQIASVVMQLQRTETDLVLGAIENGLLATT